MKIIESIPIWNNGLSKEATILIAYAVNVTLNKSATFYFSLYTQNEAGYLADKLADGNLIMDSEVYTTWQDDSVAWDFVAEKLNVKITGDYVAPVIEEESTEEPATEESTTEEPATEEETTEEETTTEEPAAEEEIITE
jgi:hypothetical protein